MGGSGIARKSQHSFTLNSDRKCGAFLASAMGRGILEVSTMGSTFGTLGGRLGPWGSSGMIMVVTLFNGNERQLSTFGTKKSLDRIVIQAVYLCDAIVRQSACCVGVRCHWQKPLPLASLATRVDS